MKDKEVTLTQESKVSLGLLITVITAIVGGAVWGDYDIRRCIGYEGRSS